MPIAPLPDFTVRAIGSSLVLNDACSVVKELVDNALDANAASIFVEISLNTLDVIQVKDNGHGIGVEDRQLVCKRGCTSKIRTMEDLEKLGGSSLGFRGEALASVAELSEAVALTTRVDGEIVGTALKFGRDGTLQNSASASHPVGATFRIQGFLQAMPVRKEVAKKAASKTLAGIKKLLYNYAYARPSVRFAFKVLRANNEKSNWSYSPTIGSISLHDTTTKITGQEVAAQCELRSTDLQQTVPLSAAGAIYSVNAVIVKTHAEASKVHNVGHYVSIDGRPVNPARGVIKNIVKLYKLFYRAASCKADHKPSNVDPFLCMHIRCPPESYDVNIEPAKDDVLFSEPSKVMALAEKLFREYYGEPATGAPTRSRSSANRQTTTAPVDNFDLMLARKTLVTAETSTDPMQLPVELSGRTGITNAEPLKNLLDSGDPPALNSKHPSLYQSDKSPHRPTHVERRTSVERSETHFNMYGIDDEDFLAIGSPQATQHPLSQDVEDNEVRNAHVTNPWSLAKLNAPARQSVGESSLQADPGWTIQLMTPDRVENDPSRQRPACPQHLIHPQSSLPSPITSSPTPAAYQNPGPPLRRRAYDEHQDQDHDAIESTQNLVIEASDSSHANTLDMWVQPRRPTVHLPSSKRASISDAGDSRLGAVGRLGFEQPETSLDDSFSTQLTEPGDSLIEPFMASNHVSKPFRSPFKGRSVPSSQLTANIASLDSACTGALPAPTSPKVRVPLPDGPPSSQRRLLATNSDNGSTSMPLPPSQSQPLFKMSKLPNIELAEILEFELRKKEAVLHQRRSQSKLSLSELNPMKLARTQRISNDSSSVQVVASQMLRDLPSIDLGKGQSNPARGSEQRFAKSSNGEAGSVIHRNSPHQNRYLAAKERLDHPHPESDHAHHAGHSKPGKWNAGDLLDEAEVRLSEDDPRAYLVRSSGSGKKMNSLTGLTKTDLKIRRTKTARLPLEAIPGNSANQGLKAKTPHPFPGTLALAIMSRRQGRYDEYVRSGENGFVRWSANSRDVTAWETTLKELISEGYRARLVEGEIVAPEVTIMLTTAIKTHSDTYGP